MNNANFISIDFETSTKTGRMPCQVGIAVVKSGQIVETISRLIKPPQNRYSEMLIKIHGINPSMTKDAPSFNEVWSDIGGLFESNFIVGHNLSFDLDILFRSLKFYGLPEPIFMGTACTYMLSHMSLEECCKSNGIVLNNHHDALCDAVACAKLFLKYLSGSLDSPVIKNDTYHKSNKETEYHQQLRGDILNMDLTIASPTHPFYRKKIVITGVFNKWNRLELAELLKKCGADIDTSISKKTNYIIAGTDPGPAKLEKAKKLKEEGYNIVLLNEDDIIKLLSI